MALNQKILEQGNISIALDSAELATIRAALCIYQEKGFGEPKNRPVRIHNLATNFDEEVSLNEEGIKKLYNRLSNC